MKFILSAAEVGCSQSKSNPSNPYFFIKLTTDETKVLMFEVLEANVENALVVVGSAPPEEIMTFSAGFCFFNATAFEYICPLGFDGSVSTHGLPTVIVLPFKPENA